MSLLGHALAEASGSADYHDHSGTAADSEMPDSVDAPTSEITGINVRSLPPGTVLLVDTRNSRYLLTIVDGAHRSAIVQGGSLFPQGTAIRIEGSTLGKSALCVGWIGVGLFLELSAGADRVIVTSRVRAIRVESRTF